MMKRKYLWLLSCCSMALLMLTASCDTTTTPAAPETTAQVPATPEATAQTPAASPGAIPLTTPSGNWWDKFGEPQYGGTITVRVQNNPPHWDPYKGSRTFVKLSLPGSSNPNWTTDRSEFDFKARYVPMDQKSPDVLEWETTDYQTYTCKVKEGIYWPEASPANGREFSAHDVVENIARNFGFNGYGKNPYNRMSGTELMQSATATDDHTVVFELSEPSTQTWFRILELGYHLPFEMAKAYDGDLTWEDWLDTYIGPFILKDYVSQSAATFVKSPHYYAYDERYPENQLPYIDELKILIIPEISTAISALRTGKLDIMEGLTWQQAANIKKSNPEIQQSMVWQRGWRLTMRNDLEPFTDIRVRKALQMAIDLPTIAKTYYGGLIDGLPYGSVGPALKGYFTPFDQWPSEIKEGYTYNPEGARQLLAEAGYPDGFSTVLTAESTSDIQLWQIIKSYFAAINVDLHIEVMDPSTYRDYTRGAKHNGLVPSSGARPENPLNCISNDIVGYFENFGKISDPTYEAMVKKAATILSEAEFKAYIRKVNDYAIEKHWSISLFPQFTFTMWQPWIQGYSGESGSAPDEYGYFYLSRIWKTK